MVIIGREFAVSGLRLVGVAQGVSIPASRMGKLKTASQTLAVLFLLVWYTDMPHYKLVEDILIYAAVALTVASGIEYFVNARTLLEKRPPPAASQRSTRPKTRSSRERRASCAARTHARPRAAVVITGAELLDGRLQDANGTYLAAELTRAGFSVGAIVACADDRATIVAHLRHLLAHGHSRHRHQRRPRDDARRRHHGGGRRRAGPRAGRGPGSVGDRPEARRGHRGAASRRRPPRSSSRPASRLCCHTAPG